MRLFITIDIGGQEVQLGAFHLTSENCDSAKENAIADGIPFEMAEMVHKEEGEDIVVEPMRIESSLNELNEWAGTELVFPNIEKDTIILISALSINSKGAFSFTFEVKPDVSEAEQDSVHG